MAVVLSRTPEDLNLLLRRATSRQVLDLASLSVSPLAQQDPEYLVRPFFESGPLNRAIYIKHFLSRYEREAHPHLGPIATKIILPFDPSRLSLGGSTLLYGQIGFDDTIRGFLCEDIPLRDRDMAVLKTLARLPSLDPFLVRENLVRIDVRPATVYSSLSSADMGRMLSFVRREIERLVRAAVGAAGEQAVDRLASKLLSFKIDQELAPLMATLRLPRLTFAEGVFAWRGYLYYKWSLSSFRSRLRSALADMVEYTPTSRSGGSSWNIVADGLRYDLIELIRDTAARANAGLKRYDDAFSAFSEKGDPAPFRAFLTEGPRIFSALGQDLGILAFVESYWHSEAMGRKQALRPDVYATKLCDLRNALAGVSKQSGFRTTPILGVADIDEDGRAAAIDPRAARLLDRLLGISDADDDALVA